MGGNFSGADPAMMQVMNILMKQRQPVQPFGPMGIPGGGFGFQGAPGGPGDVTPPADPSGGTGGDDYWPGPTDQNPPQDGFVNPSDVGGQAIWLGDKGIPGGIDDYSVAGADYTTPTGPGDPTFPPGTAIGDFNPMSFLTDMPIADAGDTWQQAKNIFGGTVGLGQFVANPFQTMATQAIQKGTEYLFDRMFPSESVGDYSETGWGDMGFDTSDANWGWSDNF